MYSIIIMKGYKISYILTISSIFKIDLTVSVAKLIAEVLTNSGCTTFSSKISVIAPLRTFIPADVSPLAWRFLNSVTVCKAIKRQNKEEDALFML